MDTKITWNTKTPHFLSHFIKYLPCRIPLTIFSGHILKGRLYADIDHTTIKIHESVNLPWIDPPTNLYSSLGHDNAEDIAYELGHNPILCILKKGNNFLELSQLTILREESNDPHTNPWERICIVRQNLTYLQIGKKKFSLPYILDL